MSRSKDVILTVIARMQVIRGHALDSMWLRCLSLSLVSVSSDSVCRAKALIGAGQSKNSKEFSANESEIRYVVNPGHRVQSVISKLHPHNNNYYSGFCHFTPKTVLFDGLQCGFPGDNIFVFLIFLKEFYLITNSTFLQFCYEALI